MTDASTVENDEARAGYGAVTDAVIRAIQRMGAGDRATLRRAVHGVPTAAFWRIAFDVLEPRNELPPPTARARDSLERTWSSLLALLEPVADQHSPLLSPGMALGQRLSEARFEKLLRAQGEVLIDELRGALHRLHADRARFDARFVVAFVLSVGQRDEESVRRAVARDYYRARAQATK
jgi:CRISPR type I-E-associated protein CasB/Cse2